MINIGCVQKSAFWNQRRGKSDRRKIGNGKMERQRLTPHCSIAWSLDRLKFFQGKPRVTYFKSSWYPRPSQICYSTQVQSRQCLETHFWEDGTESVSGPCKTSGCEMLSVGSCCLGSGGFGKTLTKVQLPLKGSTLPVACLPCTLWQSLPSFSCPAFAWAARLTDLGTCLCCPGGWAPRSLFIIAHTYWVLVF